MLRWQVDVPMLSNKTLRVNVRDVVHPSYTKIVRGEGEPTFLCMRVPESVLPMFRPICVQDPCMRMRVRCASRFAGARGRCAWHQDYSEKSS